MRAAAVVLAIWAMIVPGIPGAQERKLTLLADESLNASGLLAYIVPRFSLKHGLRPEIVTAAGDELQGRAGEADAVLVPDDVAKAMEADGAVLARKGAFHAEGEGGTAFAVAVVASAANRENAEAFADWLVSDIGRRTVEAFQVDGRAVYVPGAPEVTADAKAAFDGDPALGETLAHRHCGRCHVVSRKNRMGGIGSTPSFPALRSIPGWQDKFSAFWTSNPHPVFVQVVGVTEPFDPDRPPHIAPVVMKLAEIDAILAYVASIEPLDLGAPIQER